MNQEILSDRDKSSEINSRARLQTHWRLVVALLNFVVVAALGGLLRWHLFEPIEGLVYPYLIHAHSHLAFLGWVFMALFALFTYVFLPAEKVTRPIYTILFVILQLANLGMLFTFPFTGYALWSIIFSSLHAVASIVFAIIFIRDLRVVSGKFNRYIILLVQWSLILMIISNLGPFALGPIMAQGLGYTEIYYLVIYFYLHFQYNGWFTFAILGLLLWYFSKEDIHFNHQQYRLFFYFNLISVFPAYALSALWLEPNVAWYWIGGVAALLQLVANFILLSVVAGKAHKLTHLPAILKITLLFFLAAYTIKNVLQFGSSLPDLATWAFNSRPLIIAYLHLVLIGFVSIALLFFTIKTGFITVNRLVKLPLGLFITAFTTSELILIFQHLVQNGSFWLLIMAFLQLLAISWLLILKLKSPESR